MKNRGNEWIVLDYPNYHHKTLFQFDMRFLRLYWSPAIVPRKRKGETLTTSTTTQTLSDVYVSRLFGVTTSDLKKALKQDLDNLDGDTDIFLYAS